MILVRANSDNEDFISLVKKLDAYLKITDGDDHDFYNQYNHIDVLKNVIVVYLNDKPIACGAFKKFDKNSVEIKRMFTLPDIRKKGAASYVLKGLETWAKELGYTSCILETGIRQTEAVSFYKKNGYKLISNYGQYKGIANSLCFEKELL